MWTKSRPPRRFLQSCREADTLHRDYGVSHAHFAGQKHQGTNEIFSTMRSSCIVAYCGPH